MSSESDRIIYFVDATDRIVAIEGQWNEFAGSNGSPELLDSNVIGTTLWQHITGNAVREIYRQMLASVRTGTTVEFDFRCDSPDTRRFNRMTISPNSDGLVKFDILHIRQEDRRMKPNAVPKEIKPENWITACSWCHRIEAEDGSWMEIEEAIPVTKVFESDAAHQITHGICPTCLIKVFPAPKTK